MEATAAASAAVVLTYVINKLGDSLLHDASLLRDVRSDVEWLERELRRMCSFLEAAAAIQHSDARVRNWIREVRLLAFRAEDAVDGFLLGFPHHSAGIWCCSSVNLQARREINGDIRSIRDLVAEVSRSREAYGIGSLEEGAGFQARREINGDIRSIRDLVAEVSRSREAYGIGSLEEGAGFQVDGGLEARRRIPAYADVDVDVIGLEDDVMAVSKLLLDQEGKRSVVSVVGMGGVGKTTLAKKVYDGVALSRFDCAAWVDVSQKYSVTELLQRIGRKLVGSRAEDDEIGEKVHGYLKGRKYLIVLDDVWATELWDLLKVHLPESGNGSRILITTRSMSVARSANPTAQPYELPLLDEEESWALFSRKVFPGEEPPAESGELAKLGRQIAKKCGGLPLALVVLGGLLSIRERTPAEWLRVAERINWQETDEGQHCLAILALSYGDLPPQLKWCFLYLSFFPEDSEIDAEKLARLWVAEEFVDTEEAAEFSLEELVQRCLLQVVRRTSFGRAAICRVHDVLLEFAVSEACNVGFGRISKNADSTATAAPARRLAVHGDPGSFFRLPVAETVQLRTLLLSCSFSGKFLNLGNLRLLRVLDLHRCTSKLPEEIGYLVNLRYLGLANNPSLTRIPTSAGNLRLLQTLDLRWTSVTLLPTSIWSIPKLRHVLGQKLTLPKLPAKHEITEELRTLSSVAAGPWIRANLPKLTKLTTLRIDGIHGDGSYAKVLSSTLGALPRLNVLRLSVCEERIPRCGPILDVGDGGFSSGHRHLHVLELDGVVGNSLQCGGLPRNLTEVTLKGTRAGSNIVELLGKLEFLKVLRLLVGSYDGEEMACRAGKFPLLQELTLQGLMVRRWVVEEESMACLRNLDIDGCPMLEMLPEGLRWLRDLRVLNVRYMPPEFRWRLRRAEGADWYKVQHVQYVNINY